MNKEHQPGVICEGFGVVRAPLRACSACAGDYEDPDRTAWPLDVENAEGEREGEMDEEERAEMGREVEARTRSAERKEMLELAQKDGSSGADHEFPAEEA